MARRADWVTVVSQPNHDFYAPVRPDGRLDLIHNSPRMELFPLCDHDVAGPITVVHEGFLDHTRGMMQMLQATDIARHTIDLRLLLVGRQDAVA